MQPNTRTNILLWGLVIITILIAVFGLSSAKVARAKRFDSIYCQLPTGLACRLVRSLAGFCQQGRHMAL
jgi:hypothetical protein